MLVSYLFGADSVVKYVDKQDSGADSESKSLEPQRIRSHFFVTPPISVQTSNFLPKIE